MKFDSECFVTFPFKVVKDTIIVTWEIEIDSKYSLTIVKKIKSINHMMLGQPFMKLWLSSDSTLDVKYLNPNIIKELNRVDSNNVYFPARYIARAIK